ncbi:ABC transporter permease [Solicola gregarius]|uniref:ABC transporter permease n=1 Tax=Solicola gregarius TaxID=2908642 RepID=A0AA46TME6_9ACTN|nr:ABC transporter permease [Solicola gregarius]UYM07609.1 ABC transporter permease [Solicola gregarius]
MIDAASWVLGPVLAGLTLLAVVVAALSRLDVSRRLAYAVVRAVIQLAAVSLILVWVLRSGLWTAAFIGLMLLVGAWTSWRRIGTDSGPPLWPIVPMAVGVTPVLATVLLSGVVPAEPEAVLPIAGIIIGNSMTGTSVAGRLALKELVDRHGEYEAALALGLSGRESALMLLRPAATTALIPAMDQTRTVGLVTLPGAFIGVLLGGGSPTEAGAAQILVLVGILAAQVIAIVVVIEWLARSHPRGGQVVA